MTMILILGGPKSGKSTTAKALGKKHGITPRHFDDLLPNREWSEVSDLAAAELDEPAPWIKEGVAGARALRKWLKLNPGKVPPFEIKILKETHGELGMGQKIMHKGTHTIIRECMLEVEKRKNANK
ncbi:MAG TPA: hypothetical protein VE954_43205 [Oligoflexus sp.]|uniref:hypothetical protein n=1 Tax=Oligoflexus sp. TaxID=1971216 RepID=UPI002D2CA8F0|nr:hypothetical protein [Oligoflexus sp.]HYX39953.1 hypothetical protein [Oligoflexus sp.]